MTSRWFPRVLVIFSLMIAAPALAQAPSAQRFVPPGGPGPGLLFVSGQGGPANYVPIAKQFAAQGFHVSLIDGNDVFKPNNAGLPGFVAAIKALRESPQTSQWEDRRRRSVARWRRRADIRRADAE